MNVLRRALALVLVLLWLVPGFGFIDLLYSWNPEWAVMVEAGWGLFVSLGLALPLAVGALKPSRAAAALKHLAVAVAALVVAVVVGREPQAWWMLLAAAASTATLAGLARRVPEAPSALGRSTLLLVLAAVAVPFALTYAWQMTAAGWDGPPADITNDVDHYVIQVALVLAAPALTVLAATVSTTRRMAGTGAALMIGYSGLVSWAFPGTLAGWPSGISAAAMGWGLSVAVASWWPGVRPGQRGPAPRTSPGPSSTAVRRARPSPHRPAAPRAPRPPAR